MNMKATPSVFETHYDRDACEIGIVHLGYGAFHRAHQAVYIDDYMDKTNDLRWGIAAVNLRAEESDSFAQYGTTKAPYHLRAIGSDGTAELRTVRAHIAFQDWSADAQTAENLLTLASVHAVTITVTESGYYLDDKGALNPHDPIIAAEVAAGTSTDAARSVFAYLSRALTKRMNVLNQPLTILCCDNIRQNGKMLRANLDAYLHLTGQTDLADWVSKNVTFPCSMVDRITPRSTDANRAEIEAMLGPVPVEPILAEDFIQWVLQDNFAAAMPDLAQAGVTVTNDVDPYEEAKIRILNGGHTCLTYLAALKGIETFDAAMRDADLLDHFNAYETQEVLPGLTLDLPFDKSEYLSKIAARFSNQAIGDTVARICADGMAKFPIFIRPTLESCLQQGIIPIHGITSAASWYVFAKKSAAGDIPFAYNEPAWAQLEPMLGTGKVADFVNSAQLWGDLPTLYPQFASALTDTINEMEKTWLA